MFNEVEMSSASSTSATEFSTTLTIDNNDELPLNNEELMAPAPLLVETCASSIFAGATNLTIECVSSHFGFSFLMRDPLGHIQAEGDAVNSHTVLHNVNRTEMLKITNKNQEMNGTSFEVSHRSGIIGTVKVTDMGSLRINRNNSGPQICVRMLKVGDFAIYRSSSMSNPICNIQMSDADFYRSDEFNGSITFHLETGITTDEQLLCTAAMIAFKVTMKDKNSLEGVICGACGFCVAIGLTIFIIYIFCFQTSRR